MSRFKRYLSLEIGIEFKACMYFYCIMVFYAAYKLLNGSHDANIFFMMEMIFTNYVMCYVQVYILKNFDESEHFGAFQLVAAIGCSAIYTLISVIGNWFERDVLATASFFGFMLFSYICLFLVYKLKRDIDTKELNKELAAYKKRQ